MELTEEQIQEYGRQYMKVMCIAYMTVPNRLLYKYHHSDYMVNLIKSCEGHISESGDTVESQFSVVKSALIEATRSLKNNNKCSDMDVSLSKDAKDWRAVTRAISIKMLDSTIRILPLILILISFLSKAQNTIGLVHTDLDATDGYVLIYPDQQGSIFLLNACGEVVNIWEDQNSYPGNGSRLLEDGKIVRTYVDQAGGNPVFTQGGAGQHLEIKDWDNMVMWHYTVSSSSECMHHDIESLPNGNVLVIAWESITIEDAVDAGRDTSNFGFDSLWPDKVIELHPIGADSAEVVWEWHAWDHLIQDFNPLVQNYGDVSLHPELIDLNFVYQANINRDWLHINSIDYNAEFDQILISCPFFNEIWVIDHSTSTAEAAGHAGGASCKGGDLLYRWGNPQSYQQGTGADQKLFFNHAAQWIGPGLDPNDSDAGKIIVFNNRVEPQVSSVDILSPPVDLNGNYTYIPGSSYLPLGHSARFAALEPTDIFTGGQGSGQKLPNGHVLVSPGRQGRVIQLRPDSTISWEYILPMQDGLPIAQGSEIIDHTIMFQAEWIQANDSRLAGKNLEPIGYIELNPNLTFCSLPISVEDETALNNGPRVSVMDGQLRIINAKSTSRFIIYDGLGRMMETGTIKSEYDLIDLNRMSIGHYIICLEDQRPMRFFWVD